jgi:DNA-binding transcriptional ArsR family regulator
MDRLAYGSGMEPDISSLAALISEPARGRILIALLDGRGLPASELAQSAEVTCQTASSHLAKLTEGDCCGALGSAWADYLFECGLLERVQKSRAVRITELGQRELKRKLGVTCDDEKSLCRSEGSFSS